MSDYMSMESNKFGKNPMKIDNFTADFHHFLGLYHFCIKFRCDAIAATILHGLFYNFVGAFLATKYRSSLCFGKNRIKIGDFGGKIDFFGLCHFLEC